MNKKQEEKLKGGLNALLGGNRQEAPEREQHEQREDLMETVKDEELRELLDKKRKEALGRPRKDTKHLSRTEGYERMTTIVNTEKMENSRPSP